MSSLACVAAEVNESTSSAFLIAIQQDAMAVEFFKPIAEHVRVRMKVFRLGFRISFVRLWAFWSNEGWYSPTPEAHSKERVPMRERTELAGR